VSLCFSLSSVKSTKAAIVCTIDYCHLTSVTCIFHYLALSTSFKLHQSLNLHWNMPVPINCQCLILCRCFGKFTNNIPLLAISPISCPDWHTGDQATGYTLSALYKIARLSVTWVDQPKTHLSSFSWFHPEILSPPPSRMTLN